MNKEIKLHKNIKLVSFISKEGIFVYQNGELMGFITNMDLVKMSGSRQNE